MIYYTLRFYICITILHRVSDVSCLFAKVYIFVLYDTLHFVDPDRVLEALYIGYIGYIMIVTYVPPCQSIT